jgi:hypothetical protein
LESARWGSWITGGNPSLWSLKNQREKYLLQILHARCLFSDREEEILKTAMKGTEAKVSCVHLGIPDLI